MIYTLSGPQHIDTTIQLPASKSISNRALIIQALANGNLVPRHLSDCDDTKVLKDIHWQEDSLRFRVMLARSLSQHYY